MAAVFEEKSGGQVAEVVREDNNRRYDQRHYTGPFPLPASFLSPPLSLYVYVPQFLSVEYSSHHTYGISSGKHSQLKILEEGKKATSSF